MKARSKRVSKKATRRSKKVSKKTAGRVSKKRAGGVARKKLAKKKKIRGYSTTESGILVPTGTTSPVQPSKLKSGFAKAKKEINSLAEEIITTMNDEYAISEIELSASFSADGKFLGIGVGGATTIKIKISPI